MSRDFSAMPFLRLRHRSTVQLTNSSCLGKSRKGMSVGSPTSALRGSKVMPQSLMNATGLSL